MMTPYIWAAVIDLIRPNGTAERLHICEGGLSPFAGSDADFPHQPFLARLSGPPTYSYGVSADLSRLAGDVSTGALSILNGDGAYSYLSGCVISRVQVRRGYDGLPWAQWTPVLDGRGDTPSPVLSGAQAGAMSLPIHDLRAGLSASIPAATYGGTNAGAAGYDGTPDDIKGASFPLCIGRPRSVSPVAVNAVSRAYQYDGGPSGAAPALFDRGDAANMTLLATASSAAFDAATPSATQYIHDPARGLVRLGGALGGDLTLDPIGRAAAGSTAPEAIRWLLGQYGQGSIGADLAAWADPALIGAYWGAAPNYAEPLELLARSMGGWVLPDGLGCWRYGVLGAGGAVAAAISEYDVADIAIDDPDLAAPVWQVTVKGQRNYAPITAAASMGAASRGTAREAWLREEWRSAVAKTQAVKDRWGDAARTAEITTALQSLADMEALAARLLAALGPRGDGTPRQSLAVTVPMSAALLALRPGQIVHLSYPREGISADMLLLGVALAATRRDFIKLKLFG